MAREALHRATMGSSRNTNTLSAGRPSGHQLVRRYGMWVHRCISLNAQAAASVRVKLMTTSSAAKNAAAGHARTTKAASHRDRLYLAGRATVEPGRRVKAAVNAAGMDDLHEVTKHPLLNLLNDVNEWTDGYAWREGLYADLQIFGRAYTHIMGANEAPDELWRMLPQLTEPIRHTTEFVAGFEYGNGPTKVELAPEEVLWFRLFDPHDPWGGMGPLEAWLKTIDAALAIQDFQYDLMNRGGMPDWAVLTDKPMPAGEQTAFRRNWKRLFGTLFRREERVSFVSGGAKLERLSDSNKELEFTTSELQKRNMIGNAFGVPESILSTSDVKANSREGKQQHIEQTIWPMIQRVEDTLNERLLPRFASDGLFLMHENPIPDDRAIRVQERSSQLGAGWTVNEIRADDGMEALSIPEADEPLLQAGLSPLSTVTDPPPAPPMAPPSGEPASDEEDEERPAPDEASNDQPDDEGKSWADDIDWSVYKARRMMTVKQSSLWTKAEDLGDVEDPDFDSRPNPPFQRRMAALLRALSGAVLDRIIRTITADEPNMGLLSVWMPPSEEPIWVDAIADLAAPELGRVLAESGTEAIRNLGIEVSFNLENERAVKYLSNASRRIGRDVTDGYRDELRRELIGGIQAGESTRDISKRIQAVNSEFVPYKADRIARTETAFAAINGTEQGWQQSGLVIGKQFTLAPDACPWCEAAAAELTGKTIDLGKGFFDIGHTIEADFPTKDGGTARRRMVLDYSPDGEGLTVPPVHPNCRCSMQPVIAEAEE